jgi:hypothetical protein
MDNLLSLFTKAGPLISGLIEVGKNEEARASALVLVKMLTGGKVPTNEELDKVEKYLDEQLDKFNEDLPSEA